jgi:hypothetical protein
MSSICLLTTVHDEKGSLLPFFSRHTLQFNQLFDHLAICYTEPTNHEVKSTIQSYFTSIENTVDTTSSSVSRRIALQLGLNSPATHFFHIDCDRLFFWLEKYPAELEEVLQKVRQLSEKQFLIPCRSQQAWDSHPEYQRKPESKTNNAISDFLGFPVDVTAGCNAFSCQIGQVIAEKQQSMVSAATDVEWPLIAINSCQSEVVTTQVDGLAFETEYIFGRQRAQEPQGNYSVDREKIAKHTVELVRAYSHVSGI